MSLLDKRPKAFAKVDVERARSLPLGEKLEVFYESKYPESTWWFHKIIGIGQEKNLSGADQMKFVKHLCENDLYYFAKWVLGRSKLREQPNREMAERVMSRHWPDRQERKLILEPRETYKTTIASIAFPVWLLSKNPEISILIYSETDSQAKQIYNACKKAMEMNELLQRLWGSFKSRHWNETELFVHGRKEFERRDPSLTHAGLDSSVNGVHPDVALIDDLCSEQNTQSLSQLDKAWDQYNSLTPLVMKDGLIQMVATRWVQDDPPARIMKHQKHLFSEISVKSAEDILPNGKLYGEDIGLTHAILEQKKSMGMYRYSANYLNNPVPDTEKAFKEEWLEIFKGDPSETDLTGEVRKIPIAVYFGIDSSWADKDSNTGKDPTALIAVGIDWRGDMWLLEYFNGRIPPDEVVTKVFDFFEKYPEAIALASEDISTQKGINKLLEDEMKKRKKSFTLDKVKHQSRSKSTRIMGMQGLFQTHSVHIREDMTEFIEQYKNFSPYYHIGHEDLLDALEMVFSEYRDIAQKPQTDEEEAAEYEELYPEYDEVTGRC